VSHEHLEVRDHLATATELDEHREPVLLDSSAQFGEALDLDPAVVIVVEVGVRVPPPEGSGTSEELERVVEIPGRPGGGAVGRIAFEALDVEHGCRQRHRIAVSVEVDRDVGKPPPQS
jgi:hypothetical protein